MWVRCHTIHPYMSVYFFLSFMSCLTLSQNHKVQRKYLQHVYMCVFVMLLLLKTCIYIRNVHDNNENCQVKLITWLMVYRANCLINNNRQSPLARLPTTKNIYFHIIYHQSVLRSLFLSVYHHPHSSGS